MHEPSGGAPISLSTPQKRTLNAADDDAMSALSAFKILALGPNPAFQRVVRFDAPIEDS